MPTENSAHLLIGQRLTVLLPRQFAVDRLVGETSNWRLSRSRKRCWLPGTESSSPTSSTDRADGERKSQLGLRRKPRFAKAPTMRSDCCFRKVKRRHWLRSPGGSEGKPWKAMLRAFPHVLHFKCVLNFGEGQVRKRPFNNRRAKCFLDDDPLVIQPEN
jgi:hypothetical protein